MSKKILWFVSTCPACSKRNQLEIIALGKSANCQFCGKQFKAVSSDSFSAALDDPLDYWIEFTAHGIALDSDNPGSGEFGDWVNRIARTPR